MSKTISQLCLALLSLTLISSKSAASFLNCVKIQLSSAHTYGFVENIISDSAGLMYYCFDKKIPRTVLSQFEGGKEGDGSPGDLVFFGEPGKEVSHVGACVGGGMMIHIRSNKEKAKYTSYLGSAYFGQRIRGYRRYWS